MSDSGKSIGRQVSHSAFMRELRPELYSDTVAHVAYQLDQATFEYYLDTITARNQTHDFELFCRKLCERTVCPNLLPATGPEGGGDSKADSETIPISDEIASLSYVGEANSSRERWAFAFSAKRKWADKVRSDVAGIVETGRGYQKIYCITAQFARAKDRANIEDELTKKYSVPVRILDRTWIVEQIIDGGRKDLAFNYLGVGHEVVEKNRLGVADYTRNQQLEDIEAAIRKPEKFAGMEMQLCSEALVAAKLSRSLERPRIETEGRFARAVRLAETYGTYRQKLEAEYESIWTAVWWFDDIKLLNDKYDLFEALVFQTDHAKNSEFLCNLAQVLFTSVFHQYLTSQEAKLEDRTKRLSEKLRAMASEAERPNNALEALTSLLVIEVNKAMLLGDRKALSVLWPQFSDVVRKAQGLGEFSAERLTKIIEVFGEIAGNDSGYARLVDEVAAFVSERTSEGQGALVLLKRAKQLDLDDHFEMIRLLGKAAHRLTKKEYSSSLIEAMQLLSIAYRKAGMLWAARASAIFALASIVIEADENTELPVSIISTSMTLAWVAAELRHLPEVLETIQLVRGCAQKLPLDGESKERLAELLFEYDLILASQFLNFTVDELKLVDTLPSTLQLLELHHSRSALLYALGYEAVLRQEGLIPAVDAPEAVAELYTTLASQPVSDNLFGPVIFNEGDKQIYVAVVLGVRIEVHHLTTESSILAAEAMVGAVEALFATSLDLEVQPHTERFIVTVQEDAAVVDCSFTLDQERMTATLHWPLGLRPGTYGSQVSSQKVLVELASSIFAATCFVPNLEETVKHFFQGEAVLDRIAMIVVVGNSRQRIFKESVSKLCKWSELATTKFALQPSRPSIKRRNLEQRDSKIGAGSGAADPERTFSLPKNHRELSVRSVIDVHLWDRAGWTGTAFADWGQDYPPAIALLFTKREAAEKIFERWQERFGRTDKQDEIYVAIIRGVAAESPAHYRVLITSRLPHKEDVPDSQPVLIASRMLTMEAKSDANLKHFLHAYDRANAYLLVPAILSDSGKPEFLLNYAIMKRNLGLKMASEVGENDIEMMALGAAGKGRP